MTRTSTKDRPLLRDRLGRPVDGQHLVRFCQIAKLARRHEGLHLRAQLRADLNIVILQEARVLLAQNQHDLDLPVLDRQ